MKRSGWCGGSAAVAAVLVSLGVGACGFSSGNTSSASQAAGAAPSNAASGQSNNGAPIKNGSKVIGVSFPNASTIGAVETEMAAMKTAAKKLGYQMVLNDPGTDVNSQINTLKTWIQEKVPVIMAVTPNPPEYESVAKQALSAGTKWMTYGSQLTNETIEVGFDQYRDGMTLGRYAGQWIAQHLGGKANVAILGYTTASWGRERAGGILAGLKSTAPHATVVAKQNAITPTDGLNTTRTLLQANPNINVILCVEDPAGEGAYQAWIGSGHSANDPKAFIGGMDGTVGALKLVQKGSVYRASDAIPLVAFGNSLAKSAVALAKGESQKNDIQPLQLVTAGSPKAQVFLQQQGA